MSIISFDPVNNRFYSSSFFASVQGELIFDLWDNLRLDLESYQPIVDLGRTFSTGWVTPFIKVISGLPNYSFNAVPDTRYKIGSYSYNSGYTIVLNEDNEPISTAIRGTPFYIVYPTQTLEVSRTAIYNPGATIFDYEVAFEPNTNTNNNTFILNPRAGSASSPSNFIASSFSLNLNAGIIADIKFFYSFTITTIDNFSHDGDLQLILV